MDQCIVAAELLFACMPASGGSGGDGGGGGGQSMWRVASVDSYSALYEHNVHNVLYII